MTEGGVIDGGDEANGRSANMMKTINWLSVGWSVPSIDLLRPPGTYVPRVLVPTYLPVATSEGGWPVLHTVSTHSR